MTDMIFVSRGNGNSEEHPYPGQITVQRGYDLETRYTGNPNEFRKI
jgi:hypothetical protein